MSEKSDVLIKWKTNDKWKDCQQRVACKDIKPLDVTLEKGQPVKMLFNRHWSNGEVCEEWCPLKKETPRGNF